MSELENKVGTGVSKFFASFGAVGAIVQRLVEELGEVFDLLAEAYELLVYLAEGRTIE